MSLDLFRESNLRIVFLFYIESVRWRWGRLHCKMVKTRPLYWWGNASKFFFWSVLIFCQVYWINNTSFRELCSCLPIVNFRFCRSVVIQVCFHSFKYLQEVTKLLSALDCNFHQLYWRKTWTEICKDERSLNKLGKRIVGEKPNSSIKILGENKCFLQILQFTS